MTLHPPVVVVAFDDSPASHVALRWAADEAAARRCPMRIVHVQVPLPAEVLAYDTPSHVHVSEYAQTGGALLASAAESVRSTHPGLEVHTSLVQEAITPALLEESRDAALIVMGSRGRGGFRGLLLGSVSQQISAHAACPVIVVHDPAQRPAPAAPSDDAGRVVVGLDGSELSRDAMGFAFEYAARHHLPLTAVHTWDIPLPETVPPIVISDADWRDVEDDELALTAEQLTTWSQKFPQVDVRQRVVRGSAESVMVTAARDAALVVVGSRGRGGFLGMLLGSVSQALLHHASAPVAIVRPTL